MPRTIAAECPGVSPVRALTFDVLGLVKVIEAHEKKGAPKVVERWGEPDSSRCILAASVDDRKLDPLLAVARKNGLIEVLSPVNGDLRASISSIGDSGTRPEDDAVVGLHLFKKQKSSISSESCTFLTCTANGNASVRSVKVANSKADSNCGDSPRKWNVCAAGNILCSKVDENENYALFGGKGVELNVWDLEECTKIWNAKSPAKNNLGMFSPTWFTSATFLSKDDHRKFAAGTNNHQVRLYDMSAQRRPVMSFDFRETPIKAVTEDLDGNTVYIGNGSGDLASVDIRTGKLLGCFLGKCAGSIKSIARHPELPLIASCGLDCYLRLWDIKTRQLLSEVYLKQHLTHVAFDSNFSEKAVTSSKSVLQPNEAQDKDEIEEEDEEEEMLPVKRKKKRSKAKDRRKIKAQDEDEIKDEDEEDEMLAVKRMKKRSNKGKGRSRNEAHDEDELEEEEMLPVKRKKRSKGKDRSKNEVHDEDEIEEEEEEILPVKTKKKNLKEMTEVRRRNPTKEAKR